MPEFLLLALAAGLGVALATGPLGCFAVWRRMAYFGDTMAHSALLGVTLGLLLDINLNIAVAFGCLAIALILVGLQRSRQLASDTLLGILSHSTLALGLVTISVIGPARLNLTGYLFGDILATSPTDLVAIWIVSTLVIALLIWLWRPLLAITVHEDLAHVEGVNVTLVRTTLMLLMALVIAIAMKVVGVLLITALLIIPAAAARRLTHTPEQMALTATGIGALAVVAGLSASYLWDWPAGPAIVLGTTSIFILSLLKPNKL
ncbi:zinc ABC transporter permease subunit ZnuB [Gilvimarinus agarilyticus]|uniref:zinc ABC transporter permease subunit ZnuB n=1 Tax=Gilvimarinus sp. 2_MG-2023 TaxID=3062666 RepID=UPI001C0962FB|nr:zinc ABC transporter permease subunit ZnuB [Gilvimarinus sp. 2_MG-2023]MBU2884307.1 zinc ABC transporter permease subunit ZnuB [Gilvimarinus agarilyticus]MDO6569446.1 zinc ABC transporter permease subunit ZnuB [Gilvimarinus sp. 2_MG-2023]